MTTPARLDVADLERRVQAVYQQVAEEPHRTYHFETGAGLARRLGYPQAHIMAWGIEAFSCKDW